MLVKTGDAFRIGRVFTGQCLRASLSGPADDDELARGFGAIVEEIGLR